MRCNNFSIKEGESDREGEKMSCLHTFAIKVWMEWFMLLKRKCGVSGETWKIENIVRTLQATISAAARYSEYTNFV